MKILNLNLSDLKPGMTLYEDLLSYSTGTIILTKDTVLDERTIEKIFNYDIEKVKIRVPELTDTERDSAVIIKSIMDATKVRDFKRRYMDKVEEVTRTIKLIGSGEYVDVTYINSISKDIMAKFNTLSEVINYLNLARPLDDYTYAHSLNVSIISIIIARWLKLDQAYMDDVATAALLHDIGKTKIPDAILSKPGKLTNEEFEIVKLHTVYGYRMMSEIKDINPHIQSAALMHHEKIDGSGYPLGAKDQQIPLMAKIIAVADIYDAMTSRRSYRDKICPFEVIKNFEAETYGKLDTKVLSVFLQNIANSYLGDFVELSNGEIAEIVFINPNRICQPIVKSGLEFIDLSRSHLYVEKIV